MKAKKFGLVMGIAAMALMAPVAASAVRSTQGSNYSEDTYDSTLYQSRMKTCDMEADGRHVYAEYQIPTGEMSDVTDGDGANNGCASRGPYAGGKILKHRTVEAVDFVPDNYGNWVYP